MSDVHPVVCDLALHGEISVVDVASLCGDEAKVDRRARDRIGSVFGAEHPRFVGWRRKFDSDGPGWSVHLAVDVAPLVSDEAELRDVSKSIGGRTIGMGDTCSVQCVNDVLAVCPGFHKSCGKE